MIGFLSRTKKVAKKRLLRCIDNDRESFFINKNAIKEELETVLRKYTLLEGSLEIKFIKEDNNFGLFVANAKVKI